MSIKKELLLSLLLCTISTFIYAQQKNGAIRGTIYDSINDIPLTSASVILYKKADSTFLNFQITDYKGEFIIKDLPIKTAMYLVVNSDGYSQYTSNVILDSNNALWDLRKINMKQHDSGRLQDVVVKSVAPIKMNGDTLEINPDAFKLDSNAVVEDMLLRVPGMVVWSDGTITMNGKKIEKLLVDGKPFFGGQTNIATQNLPKDAIQKIQLYEEKDPTKIQGLDNKKKDSLYSINIQLKEDKKKGIFGKLSAGLGTDKRYDAYGVLQGYDDKNQIGIAIGTDNINKTGGIGSDAFLENTFKQNFWTYRYSDPNISGIKKNIWASAKYQHSFNETQNGRFFSRLTAGYNYINTDLNQVQKTDQTDNLITYKQHSISSSNSDNSNSSNKANINYESRKQYGDYININSNLSSSNNDDQTASQYNVYRGDTSISYNNVKNKSHNNEKDVSVNGYLSRSDYNKLNNPLTSYSLNFNIDFSDKNSLTHTSNIFNSYVDTIPSSTIVRNYNNNSKDFSANALLRYDGLKKLLFGIYNLYDIDVALDNIVTYARNKENSRVEDLDTVTNQYVDNNYLTNNNTLNNFSYSPGLSFGKNFSKYVYGKYYHNLQINATIEHNWTDQTNKSSLLYRNIARNYSLWTPHININFINNRSNQYELYGYIYAEMSPSLPAIDQLVPIVDSSNRYTVVSGNPYLKVGKSKSISYNINMERANPKAKSGYGIRINGSYSRTQNAVTDSIVYDASGKSIRYLLNGDGLTKFSLIGDIHFSRKFGSKYQMQVRYTPDFNSNNSPGYINGIMSNTNNQTLGNEVTLSFIILDKFNMTVGEKFSNNRNKQEGGTNLSTKIKNQTTSMDATYSVTKKWNISSNFKYQTNIASSKSTYASIWNATTTFRFIHDKGELKFTAFDMLRQNKNILNFLNQNSIGTTVTNGLRQYFMISFSFYPRKFGGK